VTGTVVDACPVTVTVADLPAAVADGSFTATGVPVGPTPTTITAEATDAAPRATLTYLWNGATRSQNPAYGYDPNNQADVQDLFAQVTDESWFVRPGEYRIYARLFLANLDGSKPAGVDNCPAGETCHVAEDWAPISMAQIVQNRWFSASASAAKQYLDRILPRQREPQ
jgi:hypothetical protein